MNSSSAHLRSGAGTAERKGVKGSRKGANGEGKAFIDVAPGTAGTGRGPQSRERESEAAGANPKPPGRRSYADVVAGVNPKPPGKRSYVRVDVVELLGA
jgi:hypothetical protein